MTYNELERHYYITNDPRLKLLQSLIDIEAERDELFWENDSLHRTVLNMQSSDE